MEEEPGSHSRKIISQVAQNQSNQRKDFLFGKELQADIKSQLSSYHNLIHIEDLIEEVKGNGFPSGFVPSIIKPADSKGQFPIRLKKESMKIYDARILDYYSMIEGRADSNEL